MKITLFLGEGRQQRVQSECKSFVDNFLISSPSKIKRPPSSDGRVGNFSTLSLFSVYIVVSNLLLCKSAHEEVKLKTTCGEKCDISCRVHMMMWFTGEKYSLHPAENELEHNKHIIIETRMESNLLSSFEQIQKQKKKQLKNISSTLEDVFWMWI